MYSVQVHEQDQTIQTVLREIFSDRCVLWQPNAGTPDIVIWDLDMPEGNTPEAMTRLGRLSQSGLLLLMAHSDSLDPEKITFSPSDFLLKPCSRQEILLTLEQLLHQCEASRGTAPETYTREIEEDARMSLIREKIERYIRAHYTENLSLQDVAQAMNYSETHFCRLFKHCFRVNFSSYLNDYRISQAKQLLLGTNCSVKEIARHCGYRDTSYFIRVFKRAANMTPMDYRIYVQTMSRK